MFVRMFYSDTADEVMSAQKHRRKVRKGDTNIVKVRFDKLIAPSHMHAGDPEACSKCSAILSNVSQLHTQEGTDNKVRTVYHSFMVSRCFLYSQT